MSPITLALPVFLACAVEAVEAWTIVLAMGSRSWRASLGGAAVGLLALAACVGGLALAGARLPVSIATLQLATGAVLLVVGAQWLRKAVLRAAGRKALHDEDAIYERSIRRAGGAFVVSLQAVLVEGAEVIAIVVGFSIAGSRPTAALAALAAVLAVSGLALAARAPLSRVPENTMKFCVGVMLVAFGIFWLGEGAGMRWPGADAALFVLVGAVAVLALTTATILRRASAPPRPGLR